MECAIEVRVLLFALKVPFLHVALDEFPFFHIFLTHKVSHTLSSSSFPGHSVEMPPELFELYNLYQQELETRESNEKDANLVANAEKILRVRPKNVLPHL